MSRGMSPEPRGPPSGRSSRGPPPYAGGSGGERSYKVLCVSALHPKASDDVVRDTLYREYKKYGDISVRVVQEEDDERVAYVYFRNGEEAREAKHSKSRIILFDKPAIVEAVYESRPPEPRRSMSPGGGPPPGHHYDRSRYRSRSPIPHHSSHHGGYHHDDRYYDKYGGSSRGHYDKYERYPPSRHHYRDDYYEHRSHHYEDRGRGGYHRGGRAAYRGVYVERGGYKGFNFDPKYYEQNKIYYAQQRGGHHHYEDRGGRGGYHHHHHHDRGYHHHHHGGHPGGSQADYDKYKKDKFPNYLDHIAPEDDPLATRTLFAGNMELNITEEEVRRIFSRYGKLVDVDIKRPAPGTGNAYAFIRYENLDQAARAKVELSGQYIGKFQCKIGYGKVNATSKVWVGGLGSWCTSSILEREFDRFGAIKKIEFEKGDSEASILYETQEAAQAAVQEMRGFQLGGPDKRIRIDYLDVEGAEGGQTGGESGAYSEREHALYSSRGGYRGRGGYPPRGGHHHSSGGGRREDWDRGYSNSREGGGRNYGSDREFSPDPKDSGDEMDGEGDLRKAKTIAELGRITARVWDGGLILKNSLFPTRLGLIQGSHKIADNLKDSNKDCTNLKITQRLRLDAGKLDDVTRRMEGAAEHAIFLATASSNANPDLPTDIPEIQSRPLRNLISYLKQKEAAGVISMNLGESSASPEMPVVLYCFPPCEFSFNLLKREAPYVSPEESKDEHLVVLVVCGGAN